MPFSIIDETVEVETELRSCLRCATVMNPEYDEINTLPCGRCYMCSYCTGLYRRTGRTPRHTVECRTGQYDDDGNLIAPTNQWGGTNMNAELVHYYSYKPSPFLPKGNFPSEVLMGIELEVGGDKYTIANRVKEIDGNEDVMYCKADCSIYGTEIVTHPMTLNWLKENARFDDLLEKLRDDDCYVDRADCQCGDGSYCDHSYGLHIHVSRNAFKQLRKRRTAPEPRQMGETYEQRIGREMRELRRQQRAQEAINHQMIWLMFLERNEDKLAGDYRLARRDPSHYGAFKKSDLRELRAKAEGPNYDEGRYMAINCQNDKTYELRFFKSTVDTEEFYAAVEFADASVEFTRNLDANDVLRNKALHWSEFVKWLRTQTDARGGLRYSNLLTQINRLGITE